MKRLYIIYDGRAIDDTDSAAIMVTCDSLKESRGWKGDFGNGCVIYSYAIKKKNKQTNELVDERFEEIL